MKDHIAFVGGLTKVVITDDLRSAGFQTHIRYNLYLEEKKRDVR